MAIVNIMPLPENYRKIPKRLRPGIPPIFEGPEPRTDADVELARALFRELDPESQDWYGRSGIFADL